MVIGMSAVSGDRYDCVFALDDLIRFFAAMVGDQTSTVSTRSEIRTPGFAVSVMNHHDRLFGTRRDSVNF